MATPRSLDVDGEVRGLKRVLSSSTWILGDEVSAFESEWSRYCGSSFAVGTGNGLDAIEIGLRALGIGPGDEVITSPMTAFATVLGILRSGATPVLADINPSTGLMSVASAERCLGPKTRAVLLVHLYGLLDSMDSWLEFANAAQILLLEDCAQAHGASIDGRKAGSFGTWGAFSFYPTKNLGATGDAGALITGEECVSQTAVALRNYGQIDRYRHVVSGLNSRLDELQAALLRVRLPWLDSANDARRRNAGIYNTELRNPRILLPAVPQESGAHVYHLYVLLSPERDALARHLAGCGVESLIHYPVPAHKQKALEGARIDPMGLSVSEQHAESCLSIPVGPHLAEDDLGQVVDAVNSFKA